MKTLSRLVLIVVGVPVFLVVLGIVATWILVMGGFAGDWETVRSAVHNGKL